MLDVTWIACHDGVAFLNDKRDSGISDVARVGSRQQQTAVARSAWT
jgi:hypothetical protein